MSPRSRGRQPLELGRLPIFLPKFSEFAMNLEKYCPCMSGSLYPCVISFSCILQFYIKIFTYFMTMYIRAFQYNAS